MTKPVLFYHPNSESSNEIRIDWSMGNEVDFYVPYLHRDFQRGDKPFPSKETIMQFFYNVNQSQRITNSNRVLNWKLLGGEVTRHPEFLEIAREISSESGGLHIHSCGTRPQEFWEEATQYLSHVTFDWHPEWVSEDQLMQVIETLQDTAWDIETWINPDNYTFCQEAKESIQHKTDTKANQRLVFKDVNRNIGDYSEEHTEELKNEEDTDGFVCVHNDYSVEYINHNAMAIDRRRCFTNWLCNAGVDQIIIDMQGDIWRGWCFIQKLGTIYDDKFELPDQPIQCDRVACYNGFDQISMKWDPDVDPEEVLLFAQKNKSS